MKKKVLPVVVLAAIAAVLGACASIPTGAEESTLAPDASSAVVYFLQPTLTDGGGDIVIWDGENPVGKIKGALYRHVAYRAKPGVHYFMAKRFNWSNAKVDVKANNVYYIRLNWAPNPIPFANAVVILELMSKKDGEEEFKKHEKAIAFTDAWRQEFKSKLSEGDLAEMRKSLSDAKK